MYDPAPDRSHQPVDNSDNDCGGISSFGGFLTFDEILAGVTVTIIDGVMLRDLSVPVNAMLTSNANEARAQRRGVPAGIPRILTNIYIMSNTTTTYLWIMSNFGEGERWDFKDHDSWEDQFSGFTFDKYGLFVVNDVVMDAADLGNVNFGYVTSALGISTPIQNVCCQGER